MWMRAARRAQVAFIEALQADDAMAAALAAALPLHDFALRERADARLLVSMRREDLVESVVAPAIERELAELNRPLEAAFATSPVASSAAPTEPPSRRRCARFRIFRSERSGGTWSPAPAFHRGCVPSSRL
jgi:hypothetical protein